MNVQTIAGVVNGIQSGQQTLGQAIAAIENGINEIIAALDVPSTGGDLPGSDLGNVITTLTNIMTLLGTPATGSLAGDIAANSAAISSLGNSIEQLSNTASAISTVVTGNAAAINNVDANVTAVGSQVTSVAAQITALQNSINALTAIVGDFGSPLSVSPRQALLRKIINSRQ